MSARVGLIIYVAEDQCDESEFNLFKTNDSGEQTNANVKTDRKAKLDIEQIITTLSAFADTDEENRFFSEKWYRSGVTRNL